MQQDDLVSEQVKTERLEKRSVYLVWTGFAFALLQSVCSFAMAASGLQFAFGLGSLLLAVITSAPVQDFHQDAIRLPMLIFSVMGSCINLALLWQVRRLRARPAAQWRVQPLSRHKKRMETAQFSLSIVTLALVAGEIIAHHHIHGVYLFSFA
jgi:cytochrome b subunit of formate dehydrogenase